MSANPLPVTPSGLDLPATTLSTIDGHLGALCILGEPVADVALRGFGAVMAQLLLENAEIGESRLAEARQNAFAELVLDPKQLELTSKGAAVASAAAPLGAMQIAMAMSDSEDPFELGGLLAAALGLWCASHRSTSMLPPTSDPHAADLLRWVSRGAQTAKRQAALDAYLCTVSEHGFNASTFTARVVASTGATLRQSVVGALGALSGPLHGGAPGPVLDMIDAIGATRSAEQWIRAELKAGRRIMGMGHRVYLARDPRAAVLEKVTRQYIGDVPSIATAKRIEQVAERQLAERYPQRPLRANVEFYTAILLHALEVDRQLFTAVFACARIAGWCGHVREQRAVGRLIRPRVAPPARVGSQ